MMFADLRGSIRGVKTRMNDEAQRVYSTLLTRIVRKPNSAHVDLPVWVLSADYPVPKRSKNSLRDVSLNGGLHLGGIALLPPKNRLEMTLGDHFVNFKHLYVGRGAPLRRVCAEPIVKTPTKAVRYTFKALERGTVDHDDILIFPRSRSELR